MKQLFLYALFAFCACLPLKAQQNDLLEAKKSLMQRQPNWRVEVEKTHPNGSLELVTFYRPKTQGEEPIKQVRFYESGQIQWEMDVMLDSEKETILPHGTRVEFFEGGKLFKVSRFIKGLLEGPLKIYYPDEKLQTFLSYHEGKLSGPVYSYYEKGSLKEEGYYENGLLEGALTQYYEEGGKAALIPHKKGKPHGVCFQWFPSGKLQMQKRFFEGELQGDGKTPALIHYDEEQNIIEALDFSHNLAQGYHLCYYPNGREKYRVFYREGKKEGKELFFSEEGETLGEGAFEEGIAVGTHFRKHPNGVNAFLAKFDSQNSSLEPISEYDEEGLLIRRYHLKEGRLHGPYTEWYPNGNLKKEFQYENNLLAGEQKEYFPEGGLKVLSQYRDQKHDGLYEEWHSNGILAKKISFQHGIKSGQYGEWYENGNSKIDAYYIEDMPDGVQSEWYESGQLKSRAEFSFGIKQGWQRQWTESGDLTLEVRYQQGKLDGPSTTWWSKDQIQTCFHFSSGKKEGFQEWFYRNGQLQKKAYFENDLEEKETVLWYPDGSLQLVQFFKGGKPVGEHRFYHPKQKGQKGKQGPLAQLICYDEEGRLHGEEKSFYPDSSPRMITSYEHGKPHGKKQAFNENKELIEEALYVQGKLEGKFFQKTPEGQEIIAEYKNHLKNGPYTVYYPGGEKKALEAFYKDDLLEGILTEYAPSTKRKDCIPYSAGIKQGKASFFGDDGKPIATIDFVDDRKHGEEITYFPSGAIHRITPYAFDRKEGEEKTYLEDGSLVSSYPYHKGEIHGTAQNWNREGVLIFSAEYENGKKHGKFLKFYDDGKPYIEQIFVMDLPDGEKRKYDRKGLFTSSFFKEGQPLREAGSF